MKANPIACKYTKNIKSSRSETDKEFVCQEGRKFSYQYMDCKSKREIDKKKLDDIACLEWIPPHFALLLQKFSG